MAVPYTFDLDLDEVLQAASNEDLAPLVALIKNSEESKDFSESREVRLYYPDHQRYQHVLSAQIRALGGHTLANFWRHGQGPDYRTLVCDVADHFKLEYDDSDPVATIERHLLEHVISDLYARMDDEEREAFVKEVKQCHEQEQQAAGAAQAQTDGESKGQDSGGITDSHGVQEGMALVPVPISTQLVVQAVEKGDLRILGERTVLILATALSTTMSRVLGFYSNNVVTPLDQAYGLMVDKLSHCMEYLGKMFDSIISLGGPSYRITIPCVIHIAMLRIKQNNHQLEHQISSRLTADSHEAQARTDTLSSRNQ